MPDDFATLYISEDLKPNFSINRKDIIIEVSNYISSHGITIKTNEFQDNAGRMHKESYFDSSVNSDIRWRIVLSLEKWTDKLKLFISLRPEFKNRGQLNYLSKEYVKNLALKDIALIKDNIGDSIEISVEDKTIKFLSFAYSEEKNIDISNWAVNFIETSITYENYTSNITQILERIKQIKPFSFRVIDLTDQGNNNKITNMIVSYLEYYGIKLSDQFDTYNYKNIEERGNDKKTVNVILIDDENAYNDSKTFFLAKKLPFQHINLKGQLQSNDFAKKMAIMEIYKKSHTHDLYLTPDHFNNEKIAGFLYLDSDRLKNKLNGEQKNLFTLSYIMSTNVDYTEELVFPTFDIEVYSERDYINIIDIDKASNYILKNNILSTSDEFDPFYFNIILTKELNKRSMNLLIEALKKRGMPIKKVYYISNSKLGFADNFRYNNTMNFEIPYKIIGNNIALIKMATKDHLFPQLFSTFVKVLYPSNEEISEVDIKNIIWLSKKRLYRAYSLNYMTRIEPVVIKQKNIKFLNQTTGNVNLNYLI